MDFPDVEQLRAFERVAAHLHFGRAAKALNVTQSTISHRIRRLEETLGTPLIERNTRHVQLTSAGRAYLRRARAVLRELTFGATEVQSSNNETRLSVGYSGAITATRLMDGIAEMLQMSPNLRIDLQQRSLPEQLYALAEGELDVACSFIPPPPIDGIDVIPLDPMPLFAWVAPRHPIAKRPRVYMRDLRAYRWVELAEKAEQGFPDFLDRLGGAGALPSVHVDAVDAVLDLVSRSIAIAVLPRLTVEVRKVRLIQIVDAP